MGMQAPEMAYPTEWPNSWEAVPGMDYLVMVETFYLLWVLADITISTVTEHKIRRTKQKNSLDTKSCDSKSFA
jgi:hypothetical protein